MILDLLGGMKNIIKIKLGRYILNILVVTGLLNKICDRMVDR
jgi:hypothetical protein